MAGTPWSTASIFSWNVLCWMESNAESRTRSRRPLPNGSSSLGARDRYRSAGVLVVLDGVERLRHDHRAALRVQTETFLFRPGAAVHHPVGHVTVVAEVKVTGGHVRHHVTLSPRDPATRSWTGERCRCVDSETRTAEHCRSYPSPAIVRPIIATITSPRERCEVL